MAANHVDLFSWLIIEMSLIMIIMPSVCVVGGYASDSKMVGRSISNVAAKQKNNLFWFDDDDDDAHLNFYTPTPDELKEFQRLVVNGLGLKKIPDVSKVNSLVYDDFQLND